MSLLLAVAALAMMVVAANQPPRPRHEWWRQKEKP